MKRKIIILASVVLALITLFSLVSCGTRYTVTIDLAGGTGIEKTEIKVKEGGLISDPGTPTREGYRFLGWYIGSTPKAWDFEKTVVNEDMVIRATWAKEGGSNDICKDGLAHDFIILEDKQPNCTEKGRVIKQCTKCRTKKTENLVALEHDLESVVTKETCGTQGFTTTTCKREGCTYNRVSHYVNPTGKHQWSDDVLGEYKTISSPTKYTSGVQAKWCLTCKKEETLPVKPLYSDKQINSLAIGNFKYTGGGYVNAPFVNISGFAGVTSSSFYTICVPANATDGNISTYWSADTMADGANFTGEWILLELEEKRDVGAINLVVPNYTAWELGDDCYVEYKIELLVNGQWIEVGTTGDKTATTEGINARATLVFDTPYNTDSVRVSVNHSTRFTAPIIYELEVLAHTDKTYREPVSMDGATTVSVSGKYNDWVSGGSALIDGDPASNWTTDWRRRVVEGMGGAVYAELEFAKETFVATVQFTSRFNVGRTFSLQYWVVDEEHPEGHFVERAQLAIPEEKSSDYIYGNVAGVNTITFTVDFELKTTKLRLELVKEPTYWESEIYSFTPYTIEERAEGVLSHTGCKHGVMNKSEVVAPTCVDAGYTVMRCNCGYTSKSKFTDALGHTWGEYEAVAKSGDGTRVAHCSACSATREKQFNEGGNAIVEVTQYLKNAKATWSHTLDDGNYLDTYIWGNEFMGKYKYRASMAMAICYADSFVDTWNEHFSKGVFDLVSHSYNHLNIYNVGVVSESSFLDDVNKAHYWFMNKFKGQKILGFATPNGQTTIPSAEYLAGFYYAARIGDSPRIYNLPSELTSREMWGRLNSYVSKSDQTEGAYVLFDANNYVGGYIVKPVYETKLDPETNEEVQVLVPDTYTIEWCDKVAGYEKTTVKEEVVNPETGETTIVEKEGYKFVSYAGGYTKASVMEEKTIKGVKTKVSTYVEEGGAYICIYDITKPEIREAIALASEKGGSATLKNIDVKNLKFVKKSDLASNFVFDNETLRLVDMPELTGSYSYDPSTYIFTWNEVGSYDFNPKTGEFTFKADGTGKYRMRHTQLGSYESGINTALDVGGWIIDCLHSFGAGSIYSSYASNVSKFEYMKKTHIWGASFNDAIMYLKEYQGSHVDVISMTDSEIKISLTDNLDDYMFNHALTVKVAIPESWIGKTITVTQAGVEVPFIADIDEYYDDFARKACTVMDGYLYLDAIPDAGEIVVTVGE